LKHKVNKAFTDKESGILFVPDSFYVSNNYERVKYLEKQGYITANEDVDSLKIVEKSVVKKAKTRKKASDGNDSRSSTSKN